MLLEKIIDLATDTDKPLSVLLRQCVVLGHELNNASLKDWANQELNGYSDPNKIPEYRIVNAGVIGQFNAGYAFPTITRGIPVGALDKNHQAAAETVRLGEPISAYENHLHSGKGRSLSYRWSADFVGYYQERFIEGHALVAAWQEVPIGVIVGLLDTIRTRVLNVALDIKEEIGESDADLKKVEPNSEKAETVNHIVINQIYGGTVYMGAQQTINTQNIAVGNWHDLEKALMGLGIHKEDVGELSRDIDQDGKTFGERAKSWIGKNASKVLDKGIEVGTSAGATILTAYIKRHLGM